MILRRVSLALAAAAATLLLLAGVEILLRALGVAPPPAAIAVRFDAGIADDAPVTVFDRELLYRLAPDSDLLGYYRTNARGYRGPDVGPKPAGTIRIACLGDSCTFGLGVAERQAWPRVLEGMLDRACAPRRFEVISLGVPSYSSFQNRVQVERELAPLAVDAAVVMLTGYNDALLAPSGSDREQCERYHGLLFRLREMRLARLFGAAPPKGATGAGSVLAATQKPPGRPRVAVEEFADNARAMAQSAREQGIPLLFVAAPLTDELLALDASIARRVDALLRGVATQGAPLADPRPRFAQLAPLPLHVDMIHPDATGHGRIARSVLAALFASGIAAKWVEPASPVPSLLAALDGPIAAPDRERMFAAPIAVDTALLARFDPIDGTDRTPFDEGRLALDGSAPDRLAQIEAFVSPRDPLRRVLGDAPATDASRAPARRLAALARAIDPEEPYFDRRVLEAIGCIGAGDAGGALARLDAALALSPSSFEARFRRVQALKLAGRHLESMEAARALLKDAPNDPRALVQVGIMALERNRADEALACLEKGVAADPVSVDGQYALGRIYLAKGEWAKAGRALRAVKAIHQSRFPDLAALLAKLPAGS